MPKLENLTSFGAISFPSLDGTGCEQLVVCVSGHFELPRAGRASDTPPARSDRQGPPPLVDSYWHSPETSSLRMEGQSTWYRPATDIYISGRAWAPRGRPVKEMQVAARIGPCQKTLHVLGERVWARGVLTLQPSVPLPFDSLPLVYERSFGGPMEARNPVGRGFHGSSKAALEQPLPNFEDPAHRLTHFSQQVPPWGLGPLSRYWQPRLAWAGTYDEAWVEQRAPLWPADFDPRFFLAAAHGLAAAPWLKGGEPVVLSGLSPDGPLSFPLPRHRLVIKAIFRDRVERRPMVLDAVHIEPDERGLTLIWRAAVPVHGLLSKHEYTVVRELEPWEEPLS
ncbi:DUF2169 domain-containing protein [Myxococcus sp. AM011]|uniref:DUF2169 family type VI secretion system accessory protein n=2 Tax=Myxococcus TaxID=32 RepID=UPI0013D32457|nr:MULTISPECIES: DUF2169 domain-containing protein [Myxococcus]NVJ24468.1 DUF2169 domain-containing protein [Myxococcus sp. AM011]